jgi:hypothetical protein
LGLGKTCSKEFLDLEEGLCRVCSILEKNNNKGSSWKKR